MYKGLGNAANRLPAIYVIKAIRECHGPLDGQDVLQHPRHLRRIRSRPAANENSGRDGRRASQGQTARQTAQLSAKQQTELRRMHATGDYSIADLA